MGGSARTDGHDSADFVVDIIAVYQFKDATVHLVDELCKAFPGQLARDARHLPPKYVRSHRKNSQIPSLPSKVVAYVCAKVLGSLHPHLVRFRPQLGEQSHDWVRIARRHFVYLTPRTPTLCGVGFHRLCAGLSRCFPGGCWGRCGGASKSLRTLLLNESRSKPDRICTVSVRGWTGAAHN